MAILPGSREQGEQTIEVSRELERSRHFHVEYRKESVNTPVVFRVREDDIENHRTRTWYRRVKETKRRETNVGKSEQPDSTAEAGELIPKGIGGGKRVVRILNLCWETYQMPGNLDNVLTVQQRIATLAQRSPDFAFFSLAHFIDLHWLEEAYHRTRKDGAAGVDDVTGKEYAENLHDNLQHLLVRLKSGKYKAPPVKRKHIPKGMKGDTRPIGIPTFEDKIVQRAVVMLESIYEHDFHDGSYGFRPKRGAHQALAAVWNATMGVAGGWALEVDIRQFFDTLDHKHRNHSTKAVFRSVCFLPIVSCVLSAKKQVRFAIGLTQEVPPPSEVPSTSPSDPARDFPMCQFSDWSR